MNSPQQNKITAIYPLTPLQEGILFHTLTDTAIGLYVGQAAVRFAAGLHPRQFIDAWRRTLERHDLLRTGFIWQDVKSPLQVVKKGIDAPWIQENWSDCGEQEQERRLQALLQQDKQQGFDLQRPPLMRFYLMRTAPEAAIWIWSHHHLIMDGWCMSLLLEETLAHYRAALGHSVFLPPTPPPFKSYVGWLSSLDKTQAEVFWKHYLSALVPRTLLAPVPPASVSGERQRQRAQRWVAHEHAEAIRECARRHKTTVGVLTQLAFGVLLARLNGCEDVTFGVPVSGRSTEFPDIEKIVGVFVNTVPARLRLPPRRSVAELIAETQHNQRYSEIHSHLGLVDIAKAADIQRGADLFDTLLVVENYPLALDAWATQAGVTVASVQSFDYTNYPFVAMVFPHADLNLTISYDPRLYREAFVERFLDYFQSLLRQLAAGAGQVGELSLEAADQAEPAPETGSTAQSTPPRDLFTAIAAHARTAAQRTALDSADETLTYEQLQEGLTRLSGRFAASTDPRPYALVAHPSIQALLKLLGLMHARRSFVLVDPELVPAFAPDGGLERDYQVLDGMQAKPEPAGNQATAIPGTPELTIAGLNLDQGLAIDDFLAAMNLAATDRPMGVQGHVLLCGGLNWMDILVELSQALINGASTLLLGVGEQTLPEGDLNGSKLGQAGHLLTDSQGLESCARQLTGVQLEFVEHLGAPLSRETGELLEQAGISVHRRSLCPYSFLELAPRPSAIPREHAQPLRRITGEHGGRLPAFLPGNLELRSDSLFSRLVRRSLVHPRRQSCWSRPAGPYLNSSCRAHMDEAGRIEPATDTVAVRVRGHGISIPALTADIAATGWTRDLHLEPATDAQGEERIIVYVIPLSDAALSNLRTWLAALPVLGPWIALTPVSCIPRAEDGAVDQDALACIPLVDETLARRLETELETQGTTGRVRLLGRAQRPETLRLDHLLPLLDAPRAVQPAPDADPQPQPHAIGPAGARRPALLETTPIDMQTCADRTLLECLIRSGETAHQGRLSLVDRHGRTRVSTAAQLLQQARSVTAGLTEAGVGPGDYLLLQIADNQDFLHAFWACQYLGAIPVPLAKPKRFDPEDATVRKILNVRGLLSDPLLVTSAGNQSGYRSIGELAQIRVRGLDELVRERAGEAAAERGVHDTCLVMLTSGSTGIPKAVPLTHHNIIYRSRASASLNGFGEQDVNLNWMPLDHVGGIVMSYLRGVVLGEAQVLVDMDYVLADISRWLALASVHRASYTWAPNFAFALVNQYLDEHADQDWDLSRLRFILNGGEAVVAKTARGFVSRLRRYGLPADAMRPAYGMTETCSAITYSGIFSREAASDSEGPVSVGRPVPGASLRILDQAGRLLEETQVGRLQVKGPTVFSGYVNNPTANRESFGHDGWFNTGDLAFIQDGNVTVTGREKDAIIINGINFEAHEIEAVVEEVPGVMATCTAAVAVRREEDDSDCLAIFFAPAQNGPTEPVSLTAAVRKKIEQSFGLHQMYLVHLPADDIPKTEIGKIQRQRLRQGLLDGVYDQRIVHGLAVAPATQMPNWFFRETWHGAPRLERLDGPQQETWLLIGKGSLPVAAAAGLSGMPADLIPVHPGPEFAATDAGYFMDQDCEEHYQRLLAALAERRLTPRRIIYLIGETATAASGQPAGELEYEDTHAYRLALLMKACSGLAPGTLSSLLVAGRGLFQVRAQDRVRPGLAALAGVTETARRELEHLATCLLDLGDSAESDLSEILAGELRQIRHTPFVAYRNGLRQIPALQRVAVQQALAGSAPTCTPLKPAGAYVISGGSGGIGSQLQNYLSSRLQAHILLLSRHGGAGPGETARVHRAAVDVRDGAALAAAIRAFEREIGSEVDGVFHLAGQFETRPLAQFDREHYQRIISAKVQGALNLGRFLAQRPGAWLNVFGSVNGLVGGMGVAAYATANAALAGACRAIRSELGVPVKYLAWSMWDGIGMSRDYAFRDVTRRSGFHLISGEQGLHSLRIALALADEELYIGIEPGAGLPDLALDTRPDSHYLLEVATAAQNPPALRLQDALGRELEAAHVVWGEIQAAREAEHERTAPRDAVERGVLQIWREVLNRELDDIRENFFDLGGHSLNATRVVSRLNSYFRVDAPITVLFRAPTIETLAQALRECAPGGQVDKVAQAREQIAALDEQGVSRQLELRKDARPS